MHIYTHVHVLIFSINQQLLAFMYIKTRSLSLSYHSSLINVHELMCMTLHPFSLLLCFLTLHIYIYDLLIHSLVHEMR